MARRNRNGQFTKRKGARRGRRRGSRSMRSRAAPAAAPRRARRRRSGAAAPARRSRGRRRSTVDTGASVLRRVVGIGAGAGLATLLVRAVPQADTPAKRALLVGGFTLGVTLMAKPIARLLPIVKASDLHNVAGGSGTDALFRATSGIRSRIPLLREGTSQGLLSGRLQMQRSAERARLSRIT